MKNIGMPLYFCTTLLEKTTLNKAFTFPLLVAKTKLQFSQALTGFYII